MSAFSKFVLNLFFKTQKLIHGGFNLKQLKEQYGASGKAIIRFVIHDTNKPSLILFEGIFRVGEESVEMLDKDAEYNVVASLSQETFMLLVDGRIIRKYPSGGQVEEYGIIDAYREGRVKIHALNHDIDYLGDLQLIQFLYPKIYKEVRDAALN